MSELKRLKLVLTPEVRRMHAELGKNVENFTTYEFEKLKERLGPEWAHIPLDDIRRHGINIRKSGKIGTIKGHAPGKAPEPEPEYKAYLNSDDWRTRSKEWREHWGFRCAICYSADRLDVHHRTYERIGEERETDCIAICRHCHKFADKRRKREAAKGNGELLFGT